MNLTGHVGWACGLEAVFGRQTTRQAVVVVRQLGLDDGDALIALRREALEAHPLAFGATTHEDRLASGGALETVLGDATQAVIFGAAQAAELVGMIGLVRAAGAKRSHKAVIWGIYVAPTARGKGIGRALLDAAVAHARTWPEIRQLHLSVTDVAADARRLYAAVGFQEWGREPRSLQWKGRFVAEAHMALLLE
jgi:RimJ/RimL family protein N-acetyltransferase